MAAPGGKRAGEYVSRLTDLQGRRLRLDELGQQLEAYDRALAPELKGRNLMEAASAYRSSGNTGAELRVLQLMHSRQQLSGAPYRVVVFAPADGFKITKGSPSVYIKTAESGTKRAQAFCGACGSPIYAAAPENPQSYSLRWGSIVQRATLDPPTREIWCSSAMPWACALKGMTQAQRQT